jgi:hypothetical protein
MAWYLHTKGCATTGHCVIDPDTREQYPGWEYEQLDELTAARYILSARSKEYDREGNLTGLVL